MFERRKLEKEKQVSLYFLLKSAKIKQTGHFVDL